jgi:hypothetical protein
MSLDGTRILDAKDVFAVNPKALTSIHKPCCLGGCTSLFWEVVGGRNELPSLPLTINRVQLERFFIFRRNSSSLRCSIPTPFMAKGRGCNLLRPFLSLCNRLAHFMHFDWVHLHAPLAPGLKRHFHQILAASYL